MIVFGNYSSFFIACGAHVYLRLIMGHNIYYSGSLDQVSAVHIQEKNFLTCCALRSSTNLSDFIQTLNQAKTFSSQSMVGRLTKALSGAGENFLWYLTPTLQYLHTA